MRELETRAGEKLSSRVQVDKVKKKVWDRKAERGGKGGGVVRGV